MSVPDVSQSFPKFFSIFSVPHVPQPLFQNFLFIFSVPHVPQSFPKFFFNFSVPLVNLVRVLFGEVVKRLQSKLAWACS